MFTIIGADGKEYGPVTAELIKQWMAENRLTLEMPAKRADSATWQKIRDFPELTPGPALAGSVPVTADAAVGPLAHQPGPPEPVVFTGEWAEYFKIWIVNVLLTIVTLGVYAAWAKVRKRRYFYANTRLFGHTFEYLADPVRILYGNLIVAGIFLVLTFSQVVSPLLYLLFVLLFAIAVPWFIVRALAFNARNTAWRGLRFNFRGTYGESAGAFLFWPMLTPITFGLIYPLIARKQKEFIVNRHAYGASSFSFSGRTEDFYKIYGVALLFFVPVIVLYFALIAAVVSATIKNGGQPPAGNADVVGSLGMLFFIAIPFALLGTIYLRSRLFNLIWNNTSLAGNQFTASMRARDLLLLQFVNSLVTFLTLGLMHPWAAVRTAKFRMNSLQVVPAGNVDAFVAAAQPPGSAIGDAANDFFDFDLGFGV